MPTVTPIILAAGTSSRMGRPKPLLPFGDETCIGLVLRACRDGGAGPPVVVLGADAEAVYDVLPPDAFAATNPAFAETGPAASLQAGLRHLPGRAEAFLLFPVDYPLVPGALVRALVDRWEEARHRGRRIVVPSHDRRRGHPALFDARLADEFRVLAADAPMHKVLRTHEDEIEHLETDDASVLMDMDSPEDYQRCLRMWRERSA